MKERGDYIKKLVGSNLRELREQRQLTQDELGALISVTGRTIMNIENAVTFPKPSTIHSLANAFGISPAELFLTEEQKSCNGLDQVQKEIFVREVRELQKSIDMLFEENISSLEGK